MSLRLKTFTIIGITLLVLICAISLIVSSTMRHSFATLEQQELAHKVTQVGNALNTVIQDLQATSIDWAIWDDTYAYVAGANPDYPTKNLDHYIHKAFDLDYVVIVDLAGNLLYGRGYAADREEMFELPDDLRPIFTGSTSFMFNAAGEPVAYSGFMQLPGGLAMVVTRPILRNHGVGPTNGVFAMIRFLSDSRVAAITEQTQIVHTLFPLNQPQLPTAMEAIRPQLNRETITLGGWRRRTLR
jgi:sensor domain CHASE-containing protein